jgi:uncharacterized membrane protein
MPSLTVWRYPTPFGVDTGELHLKRLEEQDAITVHDAVALIWMPDAEAPEVRRLRHRSARAAGHGGVWGALIGTLVLAPVAGAAVGAAAGAAVDRIRRTGIDDAFVDGLRSALVPGTSALFVLSSDARADRLAEFVAGTEATLLRAELDPDVGDELRALLEGGD